MRHNGDCKLYFPRVELSRDITVRTRNIMVRIRDIMVRNGSNAVVWVALCNGQMSLWGRLFAESGEKECVLALLLQ